MGIKYLFVGTLVSTCVFLSTETACAGAAVEYLGRFSNQKTYLVTDDPHLEGYSVSLYRQGEVVFGNFCRAAGIEVPCSPIQGVALNKKHELKFRVKMHVGTVRKQPAYDLIEFEGKIGNKNLFGKISTFKSYLPDAPINVERVRLALKGDQEKSISSYEEWTANQNNKPIEW